MKQIILSPLIAPLILILAAIYLILVFNAVGKDRKLALNWEKFFLCLFLFCISGATGVGVSPYQKLNPNVLYLVGTTAPTIISQLGYYGINLLLLSSVLKDSLKDMVQVFTTIITKDPFISTFLLLISLSSFWSETPSFTNKAAMVYLFTSIFVIYIGKRYTWEELFVMWRWINCAVMLISLYYGFFKPSIGRSELGWTGVLGHKNQFSFFMAQTAFLWILYAMNSSKDRLMSIPIILGSLLGMVNGGSGASKILVVVSLALLSYLGFLKKLKVQWAFVAVILLMILGICLTILVTENIHFIVVDTLHKDMSITGRMDFWPQVIDNINKRPFLGFGVYSFWMPWRGADNPGGHIIVAKTQFIPPHSHNGFLDMALELGWVGLILFICSFISNIAKGVVYLSKNKLPESGLPLFLLNYILMTNFTETGLFGITSIWAWYLIVTTRLCIDTSNNPIKQKDKLPRVT